MVRVSAIFMPLLDARRGRLADCYLEIDMHNYLEINDHILPVLIVLSIIPWLFRVIQNTPLKKILPTEEDEVGFGRLIR
jgi:hypothetical protein